MTSDGIKTVISESLRGIAPEVPLSTIDPAASLRDQMDLDSMDFLNFIIGLHGRLGIEIPEADYSRLATVNDAVTYLLQRTAPART